jgi:hypothetical protein
MKDIGKFWVISSILLPFGTFFIYLAYFVVILVYFSRFGMLHKEKSGNHALWLTNHENQNVNNG